MTKTELFRAVAEDQGIKQAEAKRIIEAAMAFVMGTVSAGEDVRLPGFGTFKLKKVPAKPARMGRNPADGTPMRLKAKPASKKITFRVAKAWKDSV